MGRLIDTSNIRVKPQYMQDVMGIAMIRCEDLSRILADAPTVEAIPRERIEQMVAEIEARLRHLDWRQKAVTDIADIIRKYTTKEQTKDPITQTISDSLVAFSKQIVGDYEKEQNNVD